MDVPPVPKNGDVVRDFKDLLQPVRDIDHRDAHVLEALEDFKQKREFLVRQRCGRFVHDDDFGVV
ncbi:hypothetical protein SDC9_199202 [bioreactor metagenome]|uniref:Uncharacterized protein n=1 Tax=bioreactor metagenome TaxID=1076179 RepID=A0A645IT43_9ZZZZ